jgi:hypothetical protein
MVRVVRSDKKGWETLVIVVLDIFFYNCLHKKVLLVVLYIHL